MLASFFLELGKVRLIEAIFKFLRPKNVAHEFLFVLTDFHAVR